jgi:hypothetical protein
MDDDLGEHLEGTGLDQLASDLDPLVSGLLRWFATSSKLQATFREFFSDHADEVLGEQEEDGAGAGDESDEDAHTHAMHSAFVQYGRLFEAQILDYCEGSGVHQESLVKALFSSFDARHLDGGGEEEKGGEAEAASTHMIAVLLGSLDFPVFVALMRKEARDRKTAAEDAALMGF